MLVIGGGSDRSAGRLDLQRFGSRVQLFQAGPRILPTEDEDVSAAVAAAFVSRASWCTKVRRHRVLREDAERRADDISKDGDEKAPKPRSRSWRWDGRRIPPALNLAAAGVETNRRGFMRVDAYLRTSAPHIFAAGDVTGRLMLVPQAIQDGFVAATNAVRGATMTLGDAVVRSAASPTRNMPRWA